MEKPEVEEIPEGYTSVKDRSKKSKKWNYIIGLFIVLTVAYTLKNYRDKRAYETVKKAVTIMKSSIEELSPEELSRFEKLREQAFAIFSKYLTEEEYTDYMTLIYEVNERNLTREEFERGNSYYFKVKSSCSPDEKEILVELEKISTKLAGLKK